METSDVFLLSETIHLPGQMWADNQMFRPVGDVGLAPAEGGEAADGDPEHQGCPEGGGHPAGAAEAAGSGESF